VAFGEALQPSFKLYARQIVENAKALAGSILEGGFELASKGTENHLMLVDLRPKNLTGKAAEAALGRAHITCNKNGVPFDTASPMVTSGIRLGTPAATSRGFGITEFKKVGELIVELLEGLSKNGEEKNGAVETKIREDVSGLTQRFPIY
jgi:glycine hydroxymethyltransferase